MEKIVVNKNDFFKTYKSLKYANLSWNKYSNLFPIKPSVELAEVVADLLTDGFIDIRSRWKSKYYGYVGYFAKDVEELEKFNNRLFKVFGIKGEIREWGVRQFGTSKGCIVTNSFLSRILNLAGVPGGDKVIQKYDLPDWIYFGSKKVKSAFLRRAFTCDGSIFYIKSSNYWEIKYSMFKTTYLFEDLENYIKRMRDLLKEFGVESYVSLCERYTRNKDNAKVVGLAIRIKRKKSLLNFRRYIGFDTKLKNEKLLQFFNGSVRFTDSGV